MLPLFGGVPGGPELLILLVMLLMMLAVPVAIAVGLFLLGRWSATRGSDETETKISALQNRIDELESELDAEGDEKTASDRDADTGAEN